MHGPPQCTQSGCQISLVLEIGCTDPLGARNLVGHVIISFIELSDGKEAKAVSFPEDKSVIPLLSRYSTGLSIVALFTDCELKYRFGLSVVNNLRR